MTGPTTPVILIDRRKVTAVLRLHIQMKLRVAGYHREAITRMIEQYCVSGEARVEAAMNHYLGQRSVMAEYGEQLVEPTADDTLRLKGTTRYAVRVSGCLSAPTQTAIQHYLTARPNAIRFAQRA